MLSRIKVALASPNSIQRLWHFIFAKILFFVPALIRKRMYNGTKQHCPVCANDLKRFLVLHRNYHLWCPVCRSLQRHRLVWLFFSRMQILDGAPKSMLHIAPEPGLTSKFLETPGLKYLSVDLNDATAMEKMDITNIDYSENTFDIIYCSHVLEHVPDDRKAISEFWRTLKPNGLAVILVPITVSETIEDLTVTDPVQRENLFGQHDHVRRYGPDVKQRFQEVGFHITTFKTQDIAGLDEANWFGLPDNETIFLLKKNS